MPGSFVTDDDDSGGFDVDVSTDETGDADGLLTRDPKLAGSNDIT